MIHTYESDESCSFLWLGEGELLRRSNIHLIDKWRRVLGVLRKEEIRVESKQASKQASKQTKNTELILYIHDL